MSLNLKTRPPGPEAKRIIEELQTFTAPTRFKLPLVIEELDNSKLRDVDGNLYIDMDGVRGSQVLPLSPEELLAEAKLTAYPAGGAILEIEYRLLKLLSGFLDGYKLHLDSCGLEALSTAISSFLEVSRGGSIVLFHKRGEKAYMTGSTPLFNVYRIPYPYCFRCPFRLRHPECGYVCVEYFKDVLDEVGGSASLVVFKPVDSSRCIVPPEAVWRRVVKISDEAGLPVLCDETEAPPGRSGKLFWFCNPSIKPSLLCLGDGLASGLPIGLTAAASELALWKPNPLKANPLSCAGALKLLKRLRDGVLLSKAHRLGRMLRKRVERLSLEYEVSGDVRGLGLMVGFEMVRDMNSKTPADREALFLAKYCFRRGLIVGFEEPSIIRLTPPLSIEEENLEEALSIIEDGFKELKHSIKHG